MFYTKEMIKIHSSCGNCFMFMFDRVTVNKIKFDKNETLFSFLLTLLLKTFFKY